MLQRIRQLMRRPDQAAPPASIAAGAPPDVVVIPGLGAVEVAPYLQLSGRHLFPDWQAIQARIAELPHAEKRQAFEAFQLAWLQHAAAILGPHYSVAVSDEALLLSPLEAPLAKASLEYLKTTRNRIVRSVLKGIAAKPEFGKAVQLVFASEEEYYEHVEHFYPSDGEFSMSSGIYVHIGCGHFATVLRDLAAVEPIIAHELTHACVAHLPIPAWLNEGLAVNTEMRLTHTGAVVDLPQKIHRDLQRFWTAERIQDFWCGTSFIAADEGCGLSYQLGRIMVEQMAMDWPSFQAFANTANRADGGQEAAEQHLGASLGAYVCALLEKDYVAEWEPDPALWKREPEKGAFALGDGCCQPKRDVHVSPVELRLFESVLLPSGHPNKQSGIIRRGDGLSRK